jgi:hypothetical protein
MGVLQIASAMLVFEQVLDVVIIASPLGFTCCSGAGAHGTGGKVTRAPAGHV